MEEMECEAEACSLNRESKDSCLICLKKILKFGERKIKSETFLKCLCHHLRIKREVGDISLCQKCSKVFGKFFDLFRELERIQLEINGVLEIVQKLVGNADSEEVVGDGAELRKLIWDKCSQRVSSYYLVDKFEEDDIKSEGESIKDEPGEDLGEAEEVFDFLTTVYEHNDEGQLGESQEPLDDTDVVSDGDPLASLLSPIVEFYSDAGEDSDFEMPSGSDPPSDVETPDEDDDFSDEEEQRWSEKARKRENQSGSRTKPSTVPPKNNEGLSASPSTAKPWLSELDSDTIAKMEENMEPIPNSKQAKCKQCQAVFSRRTHFRRHFKSVHLQLISTKFKCPECPKGFSDSYRLKRHLRQVHSTTATDQLIQECGPSPTPKPSTKCEICNITFSRGSHFRRHMANKHDPNAFKEHKNLTFEKDDEGNLLCDICKKGFPKRKTLLNHRMKVHSDKSHVCEECGQGFKTNSHLIRHVKAAHLGIRYKCERVGCHKSYSTPEACNLHQKECADQSTSKFEVDVVGEGKSQKFTMHQMEENCVDLPDLKKFQCKVCLVQFNSKPNFRRHFKLLHVGIKLFRCEDCGKSLEDKEQWRLHVTNAHGIALEPNDGEEFICGQGNCAFKTRIEKYFQVHKLRCEGLKPNEKPSVHLCPECGKYFNTRTAARAHYARNHSDNKIVCDYCAKVFKYKVDLNKHVKKKHLGVKYHCTNEGCGKNYESNYSLRLHLQKCRFAQSSVMQVENSIQQLING